MLRLHSIADPSDARDFFATFDPSSATWVVSNLKSKLDLNRRLLSDRNFVSGESVLRASELWRFLLTRLRPDLQIVSREFALTLIAHELSKSGEEWARAPGAAQAAFDYLTQLMPVLSHPDGAEMMREWLAGNSASEARWGRWFALTESLWRQFLAQGFIAAQWASGALSNEASLLDSWSRPLVVDLGAELDQVEADLFAQLSERIDVSVLVPDNEWTKEYSRALVAYEILERKLKIMRTAATKSAKPSPKLKHAKFTTMLAEVKDAVAQVRAWLDIGVAPAQIAIVAPDIEVYWNTLMSYLDEEGVPFQKDRVRRLHTYPDIARWLATLRLRTGAFSESDLELAIFNSGAAASERLISFDRFRTLYSILYDREDLARSETVAKRFSIELDLGAEVSRDDMIAWSLAQLPDSTDFTRIEKLFKKLFTECPQGLLLTARRWLAFIEQLAGRIEIPIREGEADGIACVSLSSAEHLPASRMIVLGLTEPALRSDSGTAILFADIMSLGAAFGFHLSSDDQAHLEFETRWVISDPSREVHLSVAETDFSGSAQAASWLWVRSAQISGEGRTVSTPRITRWDELQFATLENLGGAREWRETRRTYLERSLNQDLGERKIEPFAQGVINSLSPSAIEDYLECPFVFAAKRLFSISDIAELDLDVDASRRGNLMHKLFELLTVEPIRFDYDDVQLGEFVESAREASHLELADERLWPSLRARHVELAKRFLEFERDHRRQFPDAKTEGREVDVAGYLNIETGNLERDVPASDAMKFVGRIDRIDGDSKGNFAVYDYKSSLANVSQFGSWLKNNRIQLLLYAMAVENGLTKFDPHPVIAALYYSSRPLNRDYGYKVEDVAQELFSVEDRRRRNLIASDERGKLFEGGRELILKAVSGIRAGQFAPEPRDLKGCVDCQWRSLCRAPHLNS